MSCSLQLWTLVLRVYSIPHGSAAAGVSATTQAMHSWGSERLLVTLSLTRKQYKGCHFNRVSAVTWNTMTLFLSRGLEVRTCGMPGSLAWPSQLCCTTCILYTSPAQSPSNFIRVHCFSLLIAGSLHLKLKFRDNFVERWDAKCSLSCCLRTLFLIWLCCQPLK